MFNGRILAYLVTALTASTTAAVLLLGPFELSVFAIVAYLAYRVVRIGVTIWLLKLLARFRSRRTVALA